MAAAKYDFNANYVTRDHTTLINCTYITPFKRESDWGPLLIEVLICQLSHSTYCVSNHPHSSERKTIQCLLNVL